MAVSFPLVSAFAALATIALGLTTQVFFRRRRKRRFQSLELIPNVLMTRFPLLFVGRRKSIFRLSGDFYELPLYLAEHGFQVDEIDVAPGPEAHRTLQTLLSSCEKPVHLIVSGCFAEAAYEVAMTGHNHLATLTLLGQHSSRSTRPSRHLMFEKPELRPSMAASSFSIEERALEHMVSLAEYDLR